MSRVTRITQGTVLPFAVFVNGGSLRVMSDKVQMLGSHCSSSDPTTRLALKQQLFCGIILYQVRTSKYFWPGRLLFAASIEPDGDVARSSGDHSSPDLDVPEYSNVSVGFPIDHSSPPGRWSHRRYFWCLS